VEVGAWWVRSVTVRRIPMGADVTNKIGAVLPQLESGCDGMRAGLIVLVVAPL